MHFELKTHTNVEQVNTAKPMFQKIIFEKGKRQKQNIHLKNTGNGMLFVRVIKSYVPLQSDTQKVAKNMAIKVRYVDYSGFTINPAKLEQGTEFKVKIEVKVFNMGKRAMKVLPVPLFAWIPFAGGGDVLMTNNVSLINSRVLCHQ